MDSIHALWGSAYRLYGWVGPNLIRLTGDFQDDHIRLQFVLFDAVGEDEIEDYRCAATEILADFQTATMTEDFIVVASLSACKELHELPVRIFSRKLA
jgi:hypothetical protein